MGAVSMGGCSSARKDAPKYDEKKTMKALSWTAYGDPEAVLSVTTVPAPATPDSGFVIVKVYAASVNPVDKVRVSGGLKALRPDVFPAVMGYDVSGTVES